MPNRPWPGQMRVGECYKCGAWLDDHVGWLAVIIPVCPRDVKQPVK